VKNPALADLEGLVGTWKLTMTDAWFLESRAIEVHGEATIDWLGEGFLQMRSELGGQPGWHFVIGRSDANEQLVLLYHDERGVNRLFQMTFGEGEWRLAREDPDFHQRFVATVEQDRIHGRWDASEDAGQTWRKDFDLIFERQA
jgi:hypothetical protein